MVVVRGEVGVEDRRRRGEGEQGRVACTQQAERTLTGSKTPQDGKRELQWGWTGVWAEGRMKKARASATRRGCSSGEKKDNSLHQERGESEKEEKESTREVIKQWSTRDGRRGERLGGMWGGRDTQRRQSERSISMRVCVAVTLSNAAREHERSTTAARNKSKRKGGESRKGRGGRAERKMGWTGTKLRGGEKEKEKEAVHKDQGGGGDTMMTRQKKQKYREKEETEKMKKKRREKERAVHQERRKLEMGSAQALGKQPNLPGPFGGSRRNTRTQTRPLSTRTPTSQRRGCASSEKKKFPDCQQHVQRRGDTHRCSGVRVKEVELCAGSVREG